MLAPNHQFEIIIFPAYYATFWFLYYDGALNSSLHLQREGVPRHTNRDVEVNPKLEVRSKCVLVASRTGLYMLDYLLPSSVLVCYQRVFLT